MEKNTRALQLIDASTYHKRLVRIIVWLKPTNQKGFIRQSLLKSYFVQEEDTLHEDLQKQQQEEYNELKIKACACALIVLGLLGLLVY